MSIWVICTLPCCIIICACCNKSCCWFWFSVLLLLELEHLHLVGVTQEPVRLLRHEEGQQVRVHQGVALLHHLPEAAEPHPRSWVLHLRQEVHLQLELLHALEEHVRGELRVHDPGAGLIRLARHRELGRRDAQELGDQLHRRVVAVRPQECIPIQLLLQLLRNCFSNCRVIIGIIIVGTTFLPERPESFLG